MTTAARAAVPSWSRWCRSCPSGRHGTGRSGTPGWRSGWRRPACTTSLRRPPVGRDDLLKMLDLQGKDAKDEGADVPIAPAGTPPVVHDDPTALELDDWGLRRGKEVLAESERLRQTGLCEDAAADFHGAAFEPEPKLRDGCADARRHEFLGQLLQTPDYHALHQSTMLDPAASSIAACAFAEQFASLKRGAEPGKVEAGSD